MHTSPNITAVILAGGQGRRMQGADKGLLPFRGRPLIEHALAALRPQVSDILISANRNLDRYRSYGWPVTTDADDRACGPLAGILAALRQTASEYLLTVPCDAPYLSPDYAQRMYSAAQEHNATAAVAFDGTRLQPVFSLLSPALLNSLDEFLARGERRVRDFLLEQRAVAVDFSDHPRLFLNLNRPADLRMQADACVTP